MEKSYFSINHWYARDYLFLKQHMVALFGHFSKKMYPSYRCNVSHAYLICILSSPQSYLARPREAQAEIMPQVELKVYRIEINSV